MDVVGVEDHRRHPNLQSKIRTGRNRPWRGSEEGAVQEEREFEESSQIVGQAHRRRELGQTVIRGEVREGMLTNSCTREDEQSGDFEFSHRRYCNQQNTSTACVRVVAAKVLGRGLAASYHPSLLTLHCLLGFCYMSEKQQFTCLGLRHARIWQVSCASRLNMGEDEQWREPPSFSECVEFPMDRTGQEEHEITTRVGRDGDGQLAGWPSGAVGRYASDRTYHKSSAGVAQSGIESSAEETFAYFVLCEQMHVEVQHVEIVDDVNLQPHTLQTGQVILRGAQKERKRAENALPSPWCKQRMC